MNLRISPQSISQLEPDQVFVFGSNLAGRHGKGAALWANQRFGAIYHQGSGLQGQSYALPTKDGSLKRLSLPIIGAHVTTFLTFAKVTSHLRFVCTPIGCGLADYKPEDIAPLFLKPNRDLPDNVWLPKSFYKAVGQI